MNSFLLSLVFLITFGCYSQGSLKQFRKLSCPEKIWVLTHPFKAKKAMKITKQVLTDVDSIKRTGAVGTDMNGGRLDAFKHAYWMASVSSGIGAKKALKLGKAHEKGNYLEFKKHRLEDSILPDSVSSAMDLHNNQAGINEYMKNENARSSKELQPIIMQALAEGKLQIIKKDKEGNYLYCDGTFIDMNEWSGKWNIPKCLVPSGKH